MGGAIENMKKHTLPAHVWETILARTPAIARKNKLDILDCGSRTLTPVKRVSLRRRVLWEANSP